MPHQRCGDDDDNNDDGDDEYHDNEAEDDDDDMTVVVVLEKSGVFKSISRFFAVHLCFFAEFFSFIL